MRRGISEEGVAHNEIKRIKGYLKWEKKGELNILIYVRG